MLWGIVLESKMCIKKMLSLECKAHVYRDANWKLTTSGDFINGGLLQYIHMQYNVIHYKYSAGLHLLSNSFMTKHWKHNQLSIYKNDT